MSNLDFLLDCTDISEVSSYIDENKNTIVRGIFYGSEDLSWTELEYVFDREGNYISHKEINNYGQIQNSILAKGDTNYDNYGKEKRMVDIMSKEIKLVTCGETAHVKTYSSLKEYNDKKIEERYAKAMEVIFND